MSSGYIRQLLRLLGGRVARNVYFWAFCLWFSAGTNSGNDRNHQYGLTSSSWYVPTMAGSLFLQCALVYVNNLVLVPRLLARKRRMLYGVMTFLLALVISALSVILFKAAQPHLSIQQLQHPGFMMTAISTEWSIGAIAEEFQTFVAANLIWLLAFTMAWYMNDHSRQQRALRMAEEQRTRAELAFLKNQINPHFLFNTLNNIYGLALQKSDSAPDVILRLSAMLRYLLYESETPAISFAKERAAIEAYVQIEALRLPEDATIILDLHADREYQLPALLWMPMLENAFKHGTRLIHAPVSVDFSFRIEAGVATIRTINHFERSTDPEKAGGGIGLANLRKRLEILFSGRYSLERSEAGSRAIFELKMHLS